MLLLPTPAYRTAKIISIFDFLCYIIPEGSGPSAREISPVIVKLVKSMSPEIDCPLVGTMRSTIVNKDQELAAPFFMTA